MKEKLIEILMQRHTKDEMITYMNSFPNQYDTLFDIAISNNAPENWRACWLLSHVTVNNDKRLESKKLTLIQSIDDKRDGHQRELLKTIMKLNLDEEEEGRLFDQAMNLWENINKAPAVRYYAFKIIIEISRKYPELENEIEPLTDERYMESLSPGIRRSLDKFRVKG